MDEVRKWKWVAQNALEISINAPRTSIPNTSTNADASFVSKMKTFIDERPDINEFMDANAKFFQQGAMHAAKVGKFNDRVDTLENENEKLVMEISNDIRDSILLDC